MFESRIKRSLAACCCYCCRVFFTSVVVAVVFDLAPNAVESTPIELQLHCEQSTRCGHFHDGQLFRWLECVFMFNVHIYLHFMGLHLVAIVQNCICINFFFLSVCFSPSRFGLVRPPTVCNAHFSMVCSNNSLSILNDSFFNLFLAFAKQKTVLVWKWFKMKEKNRKKPTMHVNEWCMKFMDVFIIFFCYFFNKKRWNIRRWRQIIIIYSVHFISE